MFHDTNIDQFTQRQHDLILAKRSRGPSQRQNNGVEIKGTITQLKNRSCRRVQCCRDIRRFVEQQELTIDFFDDQTALAYRIHCELQTPRN